MKTVVIILTKSVVFFVTLFILYFFLFEEFKTPFLLKKIIFPSVVLSVILTIFHVTIAKKVGVKNNFSVY